MTFKEQVATDLDIFFNTDEFAEEAVKIVNSVETPISVIFEQPYERLDEFGGVEASNPAVICKSADVLDVNHGSQIRVGAVTYYVKRKMPDADGVTTLEMSKNR